MEETENKDSHENEISHRPPWFDLPKHGGGDPDLWDYSLDKDERRE